MLVSTQKLNKKTTIYFTPPSKASKNKIQQNSSVDLKNYMTSGNRNLQDLRRWSCDYTDPHAMTGKASKKKSSILSCLPEDIDDKWSQRFARLEVMSFTDTSSVLLLFVVTQSQPVTEA